jgi:hypothetical protein
MAPRRLFPEHLSDQGTLIFVGGKTVIVLASNLRPVTIHQAAKAERMKNFIHQS